MIKKPIYEELGKENNELEKLSFKHKHVETLLQKKSHEFQKRVKELTCLYAISNLFENPDVSVEDVFERTFNLLPAAWQYPGITCARIVLKNQAFQTDNFKETVWRQVSSITIDDDSIGTVEVYYLEERSDIDEGPFLQEERKLITAVAEKLGKIMVLIYNQVINSILNLKRTCPKCKRALIVSASKRQQIVRCKFCRADVPPIRRG